MICIFAAIQRKYKEYKLKKTIEYVRKANFSDGD